MPEKTTPAKIGKAIIPVNLVGQNIDCRVLKKPARGAYPNGKEVIYSDDYVRRLNETYPLNKVLGENVKDIANKRGLEKFVMDSPLQNSEGEDILAFMLINSAQAESWQPFIVDVARLRDTEIKTAREYIQSIEESDDLGKIHAGILFGLKVAKNGQFASVTEYEGKIISIPSQSFVEYVAEQR